MAENRGNEWPSAKENGRCREKQQTKTKTTTTTTTTFDLVEELYGFISYVAMLVCCVVGDGLKGNVHHAQINKTRLFLSVNLSLFCAEVTEVEFCAILEQTTSNERAKNGGQKK